MVGYIYIYIYVCVTGPPRALARGGPVTHTYIYIYIPYHTKIDTLRVYFLMVFFDVLK
jgi:hypothetical protein